MRGALPAVSSCSPPIGWRGWCCRALAAAFATAATPLVTVHARIMKEGGHFPCALPDPRACGADQAPARPGAVARALLGVYAGLAAGAKYIGILFLPFALSAILLIPTPRAERRLRRVLTVAGVAILVFALIELPALRHLAKLRLGVYYEYTH